ncbi:MAG: serine hydrolase domain-containing protein [Pseudomonadota bacterium]
MKLIDARGFVPIAFACVAILACATQAAPLPKAQSERLVRFVTQFEKLAMFDGSILIDVGGEVVFERSFGRASYEQDARHGPETRFRIASVSKMLTDVAMARMQMAGKLNLREKLSGYLPDFPGADRIALSMLLDHTSGIAHTNRQPWGEGSQRLTLDEIVARLALLPLDFEPGSDSSYSNGGYAVAAKVLEIAGEGSYAEVMRRTVFEPLAMVGSGHLANSRVPVRQLATGYEPGAVPGQRRFPRFYAVETRPGGGSLIATARDLHRLTAAVFRNDFVDEALRRSVLGAEGSTFLSQGRSPGFVAKLYFDRGDDVIVISLANNYAVPADWAAALADLALGRPPGGDWPVLKPSSTRVLETDPRLGEYLNSRGNRPMSIRRSSTGGLLLFEGREAPGTALVPLADGAFLIPHYFQRCQQDAASRQIECRILSGNPRYSSTLTAITSAGVTP